MVEPCCQDAARNLPGNNGTPPPIRASDPQVRARYQQMPRAEHPQVRAVPYGDCCGTYRSAASLPWAQAGGADGTFCMRSGIVRSGMFDIWNSEPCRTTTWDHGRHALCVPEHASFTGRMTSNGTVSDTPEQRPLYRILRCCVTILGADANNDEPQVSPVRGTSRTPTMELRGTRDIGCARYAQTRRDYRAEHLLTMPNLCDFALLLQVSAPSEQGRWACDNT